MQEHKKILPTDETLPIYTKYENFGRGVNAVKAVKAINDKLIQKHETAAIDLADQFLLQLIPAKKNEKPRKRKATRSPLFKRK